MTDISPWERVALETLMVAAGFALRELSGDARRNIRQAYRKWEDAAVEESVAYEATLDAASTEFRTEPFAVPLWGRDEEAVKLANELTRQITEALPAIRQRVAEEEDARRKTADQRPMLIWSEIKSAWWAPEDAGYDGAVRMDRAGRFTAARAAELLKEANLHCEPGKLNNVAIPDPMWNPSDTSDEEST